MDEFEIRNKERSQLVNSNWGLLIGFLVNLFLLGYNFLDVGDNYYEGERLTSKMLILDDKIKYTDGRLFETDRLSFKTLGSECSFSIISGAFKVVDSDRHLLNRVLKIDKGDTIIAGIYKDHVKHMNDNKWDIPVIELSYKKDILISRRTTELNDSEATRWDLILGVVLGIALILFLRESINT